jgi:hypothetical protein
MNPAHSTPSYLRYCHVSGVPWRIMSSGLYDWIYWQLVQSARTYRQYSDMADLHKLSSPLTHALGFSVFTSRILVTESEQEVLLQITMKSSFRFSFNHLGVQTRTSSPFLALRHLTTVLFFWNFGTQLLKAILRVSDITSLRTTHKTQSIIAACLLRAA